MMATDTTLSASIKELESLLEATLVDRSKRSVVLTPLGLETVERARKIIADCEELTRDLTQRKVEQVLEAPCCDRFF